MPVFDIDYLPADCNIEYNGKMRHLKFPSKIQLYAAMKHLGGAGQAEFIGQIAEFRKIDTLLDIGANVGSTMLLYRMAFPSAFLYGIEPARVNWECLVHNLTGLENVKLIRKAAGTEYGTATLTLPTTEQRPDMPTKKGNSGLYSIYGEDHRYDEVVEMAPADDLVDRPIDYLKIDVEGAEMLVLQGCQRILTEDRPIVQMEAREGNMTMAGHSRDEYRDYFAALKYVAVGNYIGDVIIIPHELYPVYGEWAQSGGTLRTKDISYSFDHR